MNFIMDSKLELLFNGALLDGLKGFIKIRNQSSGFEEKESNLKRQ